MIIIIRTLIQRNIIIMFSSSFEKSWESLQESLLNFVPKCETFVGATDENVACNSVIEIHSSLDCRMLWCYMKKGELSYLLTTCTFTVKNGSKFVRKLCSIVNDKVKNKGRSNCPISLLCLKKPLFAVQKNLFRRQNENRQIVK